MLRRKGVLWLDIRLPRVSMTGLKSRSRTSAPDSHRPTAFGMRFGRVKIAFRFGHINNNQPTCGSTSAILYRSLHGWGRPVQLQYSFLDIHNRLLPAHPPPVMSRLLELVFENARTRDRVASRLRG